MAYRLYSGPTGADEPSPLDRTSLYKEFTHLDDALSFARFLRGRDRVALIIEGDDGTRMNRREIAAAIEQSPAMPEAR